MIDFVSEVPDSNEPVTVFSNFSSNPTFVRSFSNASTVETPATTFQMTHANFVDGQAEAPQNFMSLAQLSREYSSYLLLNVSPLLGDISGSGSRPNLLIIPLLRIVYPIRVLLERVGYAML
jgi:hypothetical protein